MAWQFSIRLRQVAYRESYCNTFASYTSRLILWSHSFGLQESPSPALPSHRSNRRAQLLKDDEIRCLRFLAFARHPTPISRPGLCLLGTSAGLNAVSRCSKFSGWLESLDSLQFLETNNRHVAVQRVKGFSNDPTYSNPNNILVWRILSTYHRTIKVELRRVLVLR